MLQPRRLSPHHRRGDAAGPAPCPSAAPLRARTPHPWDTRWEEPDAPQPCTSEVLQFRGCTGGCCQVSLIPSLS